MELPITLPGRSHGLKLFVVCVLVLFMAIPAMFISYVSFERSSRANAVISDVSERYGGPQTISGPFVLVPFARKNLAGIIVETGDYVFFPEDGLADFGDIKIELRKRSLFKIPVYQAKGQMTAKFSKKSFEVDNQQLVFDWKLARIFVGVTNGRSLQKDITLQIDDGDLLKFEPAFLGQNQVPDFNKIKISKYVERTNFKPESHGLLYLSVPATDFIRPGKQSVLKTQIVIGGTSSLSILPFAKSTAVTMRSNWSAPGFVGSFPPNEREIEETGFSAQWSVPFLARGVAAHGKAEYLLRDNLNKISVNFVPEYSAYQTVNRALKYAVLFVGLVFITFFLFEIMIGKSVHPAQYVLIGLAQSIFYLLLLAFSEHIGFNFGFLIAAAATIGLTAFYAGWTFGDSVYARRAGIVFTLTYGLLFSLMRMQDFALMLGALASFFAVALIMYLTRNMDWYGKKAL